jgi:single-strand DNA-binding protein
LNSIILVGRLTRDPEIKYIGEKGIPVASFTLAVDRKIKKEIKCQKTDFIKIEAWREAADICANKFKKGSLASVTGELRIDEYEHKDGNKKYMTKVTTYNVNLLEHSNKQFNGVSIFKDDDNVKLDESALPF